MSLSERRGGRKRLRAEVRRGLLNLLPAHEFVRAEHAPALVALKGAFLIVVGLDRHLIQHGLPGPAHDALDAGVEGER